MKQTEYVEDASLTERWLEFCAGDADAFGELVGNNFNILFHYGTKFSSDKDLVKDCIQDLFMEIWEKRERLHHIVAIKPYLFQSIRNNLIARLKKQSKYSDIADLEGQLMDDDSPELNWIIQETDVYNYSRLENAIGILPKRQREALYLKYYEDLSHEEIARIMGLQRQAVANYIHYGILKLREYWKFKTVLLTMIAEFYHMIMSAGPGDHY